MRAEQKSEYQRLLGRALPRVIRMDHIRKLSQRFHVSPELSL